MHSISLVPMLLTKSRGKISYAIRGIFFYTAFVVIIEIIATVSLLKMSKSSVGLVWYRGGKILGV